MDDKYLTVTALTKYIKRKFELDKHLTQVWLRGEISNFKHHSRGHMYLTLKDNQARIQAVMFAGHNRSMKFQPENGMNVLVKGEVGVYEPQGQYQLYIQQMEPDGIGSLYLAFEQLKEKLAKEGLFDESSKKTLPAYPGHIAVVTSPTGAAVRDILITLQRRFPVAKISLLPVQVQGERSAESIVKAIETVNRLNKFDVMIVGRGGGSIEELWNFNEEKVARAIYASSVPVISAVGHETDFTISDFVADVRAATPTAAAELAVPSQTELKHRLHVMQKSMERLLTIQLRTSREKLVQFERSYAFRYPGQLLRQKEQELDRYMERLTRALQSSHRQNSEKLVSLQKRLDNQHPAKQMKQSLQTTGQLQLRLRTAIEKQYDHKRHLFTNQLDKLSILNPLDTMKRGYSITYTENNNVIKSVGQVKENENILVSLSDGTLNCKVTGTEVNHNE